MPLTTNAKRLRNSIQKSKTDGNQVAQIINYHYLQSGIFRINRNETIPYE